jgi:hypothetical protein
MPTTSEVLYSSSNGDQWKLVRDTGTGQIFVRHQPNEASGGRTTETDVCEFLNIDGAGPEFLALRRMLAERSRSVRAEIDLSTACSDTTSDEES